MRLLLDESVPSRFRQSLPKHEVRTVVEMGWSGKKNGPLLQLAARGFDALVTTDKNLPHQQNPATLPIAVIVLDSYSNELSALLPLIPQLEEFSPHCRRELSFELEATLAERGSGPS